MAFLGQDGFYWGIGVVEDRFDPEKLNRVRVRWLGLHDEDKEKILTKDLPWAQVMQPVSSSSMAGVGDTTSSIKEGTWVVGFAKDVNSLQDWIVMGTLPGDNTTTALQGESDKKWAKYRGNLKEYNKEVITEQAGRRRRPVPIEASLANKFVDYEKGFHDPTVDMRNVPYPPSDVTIGHSQKFYDYDHGPGKHYPDIHENALEKPRAWYANSESGYCGTRPKFVMKREERPDDMYIWTPRLPNYKPAGKAPNDLKECSEDWAQELPPYEGYAPKFVRLTHSDILHYLYRTTRRVTADARQCPEGFGTFTWPDVQTYGYQQRMGNVISTGYLEDDYWRADKEAGKAPGGTWAPTWPITRDTPTVSKDSAGMTGIDPLDNRASWGQESGDETGYFLLDGEEYRISHPRTRYVQKGKLTPSHRLEVKELFEAGQYGTGIYNISNPNKAEARKDIKWKDVKNTDLVLLPEKDTNRLAEGGIPIQKIDGNMVTTKVGLYGDSTNYFAQPKESRGKNAKPLIQKGDIIMISGVRGAEEYNGRIYRCMTVTDKGTSFEIKLGTQDGIPWSGPGSIEYADTETTTPSVIDAVDLHDSYYSLFSAYLGEGVITVNPHWSIRAKAETRERQINIGNPEMNTGINSRFWNQPTSRWAAQYPYNHVYETESGHIREYDDTPGAERIHEMHRSGTYYEVDHQGTKVDYVKGDNYNIRIFDDYLYVKGKVAWTADDEIMIRANDRMDISAKWKIQIHSGGDLDLSSKRNVNIRALGDINMQYDGHMNILGTALGPESAKYHAGTRKCKELSILFTKTGNIQTEAIESIKIQADIKDISLKTLTDNIFISSMANIEQFSYLANKTYALTTVDEFSASHNNRTTAAGDIYETTLGGNIYEYAAAGQIRAEAIAGTIDLLSSGAGVNITALTSKVEVWAAQKINLETLGSDINIKSGLGIFATSAEATHILSNDLLRITSKKDMDIKSIDAQILLEAKSDSIHIKSETSLYLQSDIGSIYSKAWISHYMQSGLNFNNLAAGNIIETATQIHMNGPAAAPAEDATAAADAAGAIAAFTLTPETKPIANLAYLAPTIDIIPIDIPDPDLANPIGLGLNANDPVEPGSGYGGENIRVTHDTINDIIAGKSNTKF